MKTYIAQRRIDHDNQPYEVGELLALDEKTAAPLLAVGAAIEYEQDAPTQDDAAGNDEQGKKSSKKDK